MSKLASEYAKIYEEVLKPISSKLSEYLQEFFRDLPRIDRISTRPKSVERFIDKASIKLDGVDKYDEPLVQIQDQVGARIIVFYNQDVESASSRAEEYFRHVEKREVQPIAESEFSYFGKHYIFFVPEEVIPNPRDHLYVPRFFELQIKTLFQHAWSEASHDVGYKPVMGELHPHERRLLAFASAQAWGADNAFSEIFNRVSETRH